MGKGGFQRLTPNVFSASDAQKQRRAQPERRLALRRHGIHHQRRLFPVFGGGQPLGGRARYGPAAPIQHGFACQQRCRHGFDRAGIHHPQAKALGPRIGGKHISPVGGGGDHRLGPGQAGNGPGQPVGPAQMPRQNGNGVARVFIHHHHGRVNGFALHIRRNGPHRNAGRAHKHQRIA